MSTPPSYEAWNRAIADSFFNSSAAHRPIYLQLDSETLCDIGARMGIVPESAESLFVRAVRERLQTEYADTFAIFRRRTTTWQALDLKPNPQSPPPFIGLLGLCVLAASHMTNDDVRRVSSANYYVWLNELLGLSREGAPPGFADVGRFWEILNDWLDTNRGTLGLPSAQTHSFFIHVGYPISQCLLRQTDRERLPDFFHWAGFDAGEEVELEGLQSLLQDWAQKTTCTLTRRGCELFSSGSSYLLQSVAQVVAAELRAWTGVTTDTSGTRHSEIALIVQLGQSGRRVECELYPHAPPDFPEGKYRVDRTDVELKRLNSTEWFTPLTGDWVMTALTNGLTMRQGKYTLAFNPAPVMALSEHDLLKGWVSCSRVRFDQIYLVLCRAEYADAVQAYLLRHARHGWQRVAIRQGVPPNWVCFRNIVIESAIDSIADALECLRPTVRFGIHLVGGLRIEQGVWLVGGEPDLEVTMPDRQSTAVWLDGNEIGAAAEGHNIIALNNLGLTAGEHEIRVGNRRRQIRLRASGDQRLQPSDEYLGYALHFEGSKLRPISFGPSRINQSELEKGHIAIVGAQTIGSINKLALTYGYKRYILLGRRPGEVAEFAPHQDIPFWILRKSGDLHGEFEVVVNFDPHWLIRVGAKGKEKLSSLHHESPQPPDAHIANADQRTLWVRWAHKRYRNVKATHPLYAIWEEYRRVAAALNDR
jgi:hypothetical protein